MHRRGTHFSTDVASSSPAPDVVHPRARRCSFPAGLSLPYSLHPRDRHRRRVMCAQRSGMKIDLDRNEPWTPINSGNELDPRLPQKPNFSTLGSRTALAFFQKTSKNSHISVVVAPIGLKFCVCARFCSSGLLGHFQLNRSNFLTVNLT